METIKQLIDENSLEEAIGLLNARLEKKECAEETHYLLGNAYRKLGDVRQAMNHYLEAMDLNPESPARIAYNQLIRIMDFYHKDRYNQ